MSDKLLKVLARLEQGEDPALVCELPPHLRHLLSEVTMDDAGEVDLAGLLTVCQHVVSTESEDVVEDWVSDYARAEEEAAINESARLYRLIYDRSLAVDPVCRRQSVRQG